MLLIVHQDADLCHLPDRQPHPDVPGVFHCGWASEKSFAAAAYLIVRPPEQGGNILVDSPR
jgi:hypothetical protein